MCLLYIIYHELLTDNKDLSPTMTYLSGLDHCYDASSAGEDVGLDHRHKIKGRRKIRVLSLKIYDFMIEE